MSDNTGYLNISREQFKYRHSMLVFCTLGSFLILTGRTVIPPLASPIKSTVGIDNSEFGFALTLMWVSYSLMQFPSGIVSDQIGHKVVIISSIVGASLGFSLLSSVFTYPMFMLGAVVVGIGSGSYTMVRFRFLSELFVENKGRAFGISGGVSNLAGVIAPASVSFVLVFFGWQVIFLGLGILLLGTAVLFHDAIDETYNFEISGIFRRIRNVPNQILTGNIVLMVLVSGLYSFVVQGMTSFLPLYMSESKGLSFGMAGAMLSIYYMAGTAIRPVSGWLSDQTDRRLLSTGALFISGTFLSILVISTGSLLSIVFAFSLFAIAFNSFSVSWDAYFMDIFDEESMGGSFGIARMAHLLIGSSGSFLIGIGTETIGYDTSFLGLAGILVLAALISLTLIE